MNCFVCGIRLKGRQRKFCSSNCKNRDTNNRHQNYEAQKRRGLLRKSQLLEAKGAHCSFCGYSRNTAALVFHHLVPHHKGFQLDLRNLSNRNWDALRAESSKCIVLCANCHAEHHHPENAVPGA